MLRCRELRPVQCLISPRLRSGLFLLEFLSVERLLRITIKNARIPCEIGRFRVQIMYILRKTLKIKVYCGDERNSNPSAIIPKTSWTERLDSLLKINVSSLGKKFETLKKGLIKCRDYIFNFLEDPLIPSDNNGSERGIRKLKIKLKNSCTFRSDLGADAFLELHSIVETAKKHNQTPFNAIQALFGA